MSRVMVDLSISLDGFIAGPNDGLTNPLGDGGGALFTWMGAGPERNRVDKWLCPPDPSRQIIDEWKTESGAGISGRRTFDIARGWKDGHPIDAPNFVVTHAPPTSGEWSPQVRFVTDLGGRRARPRGSRRPSRVGVRGQRRAAAAACRAPRRDQPQRRPGAAGWRCSPVRRCRSGRARAGPRDRVSRGDPRPLSRQALTRLVWLRRAELWPAVDEHVLDAAHGATLLTRRSSSGHDSSTSRSTTSSTIVTLRSSLALRSCGSRRWRRGAGRCEAARRVRRWSDRSAGGTGVRPHRRISWRWFQANVINAMRLTGLSRLRGMNLVTTGHALWSSRTGDGSNALSRRRSL